MLVADLWKRQPGKYFCLSTKPKRGNGWQDHWFERSQISRRAINAFLADHRDHNIYFCPHGFSRKERKKDAAVPPTLLWADLDKADPRHIEWEPTIAIESSPGRYVGLWEIDDEADERLNQRLTYAIGADKGGWDLTQVLRCPGSLNHKYPDAPEARVLWDDGPRWKVRDLKRELPTLPEPNGNGADHSDDAQAIYREYERRMTPELRRELLNGKPTPGKRSDMCFKLGGDLVQKVGTSVHEATILVAASPWNKFRGRRDEYNLIRRGIEKIIAKHLDHKADNRGDESDEDYFQFPPPLSEVEEEEIDWLWWPYLARGELSILEGDPGLGKSYLAQIVALHFCDGKPLPTIDRARKIRLKPQRVLAFDYENSAGSVTRPRLEDNGIERLDNFIQDEEVFTIDDPDAWERVRRMIEHYKPALVIFDTLNSYIGKSDTYKASEAQQAFTHFRALAKDFHISVLVLRHLTKGGKEKAIYRGQGSIAFTGLARTVMTVGVDPNDPDTRVMAVTKINITRLPKALTFTILELPNEQRLKRKDRSRFEFGEFVELTADQIISKGKDGAGKDKEDAKAFIRETFEDADEIEARRIEQMAEAHGISVRTLQRAAKEMGVEHFKTSSGWMWRFENPA